MPKSLYRRPLILLVALFTLGVFNSSSCDSPNPNGPVIGIPACACILRGAAWTKDPSTNGFVYTGTPAIANNVNNVIDAAGKSVWLPEAGIGIVPQVNSSDAIPVIDYPNVNNGLGDLQDVDGEDVAQQCRNAWGKSIVPGGLVIVIAHKLVSAPESGFSPDPSAVYSRNNQQDMCSFPRHITSADMLNKYVILEDPTLIGLNDEKGHGKAFIVLAHELGHVFLLMHGDGLDNDHNGLLPPNAGPRLFDSGCDIKEYNQYDLTGTSVSLMDAIVADIQTITPLQTESARAAAQLMPGANGH